MVYPMSSELPMPLYAALLNFNRAATPQLQAAAAGVVLNEVVRHAKSQLGARGHQDVDDIVQIAMLRLWRSAHDVTTDDHARARIVQCVTWTIRDQWRSTNRRREQSLEAHVEHTGLEVAAAPSVPDTLPDALQAAFDAALPIVRAAMERQPRGSQKRVGFDETIAAWYPHVFEAAPPPLRDHAAEQRDSRTRARIEHDIVPHMGDALTEAHRNALLHFATAARQRARAATP